MSGTGNRKRIMLIIPEMCVGGAQRSVAALSLELAQHYTVFVVIFNRNLLATYRLGGELISLDVSGGHNPFTKVAALRKRVKALKAEKVRRRIDVAISFLEGADYVNILSRSSERVVLSIRGTKLFDKDISGWLGWLRKNIFIPLLYPKADAIVAVSDGIRKELIHKIGVNGDRVITLYNFTGESPLGLPPGITLPGGRRYLVSIGRLHRQKDLENMIRIYRELADRLSDVGLVLVGDGEMKEELIQLARSLGLRVIITQADADSGTGPCVYFTGFADAQHYLKVASFLLLTSRWEGFPNVMLEALAHKVPVVSSDCPTGPREILCDEEVTEGSVVYGRGGVLLPVIDSQQHRQLWVDTLVSLLQDDQKQALMREEAVQRAGRFSGEKALAGWRDIIDQRIELRR